MKSQGKETFRHQAVALSQQSMIINCSSLEEPLSVKPGISDFQSKIYSEFTF